MTGLNVKPWEMGEEKKSTGIPSLCTGKFMIVKLAPPREKTIRDGFVNTLIMTSYFDSNGKEIETITVEEGPDGYKAGFPFGKRSLIATKYRGPKSYYRFQDAKSGDFYEIPQSKFTLESATSEVTAKLEKSGIKFDSLSADEQSQYIDEYYDEMYNFGMSQDLLLPIEGEDFIRPTVGLTTKLYRVYTPPLEGERYGNIIVTKWKRGLPNLDGEYQIHPEELATTVYEEYQKREATTEFDPTTFVENEGDDVI